MLSICYELTTLLVLIEIKEVNPSCLLEMHNIISMHVCIILVQTTNVTEIEKEIRKL